MRRIKPLICFAILMAIANTVFGQKLTTAQKVDALLKKMTLAEKIGQLNQVNGDWEATGPITTDVGNKLGLVLRADSRSSSSRSVSVSRDLGNLASGPSASTSLEILLACWGFRLPGSKSLLIQVPTMRRVTTTSGSANGAMPRRRG